VLMMANKAAIFVQFDDEFRRNYRAEDSDKETDSERFSFF